MAAKTTKAAPRKVSKAPVKKTVTKAAPKAAPKVARAKAAARAKPVLPEVRPVAPVTVAKPTVTPKQHHEMVRLEAYLLAERNGFQGDPNAYWRAAELNVAGRSGR